MKYFTIQVHLCDEKTVHEVKDVEETNINKAHEIWHRGIKIRTSPVAWEIVSPFFIKRIFLIQQPHKFGNK